VRKIATKYIPIILFAMISCTKSQYSATIVNKFNSEYLEDHENKIWRFLVEEKYLLDSAICYLPPSNDTTFVFIERNWCNELACLAFNSKNEVYFKLLKMKRDSFKIKSTHYENLLPQRDFYEIKKQKLNFNKEVCQNIFYNKDSIEIKINPSYCSFFNETTLTYWLDSAQNLNFKIYRIKILNNKRVNSQIPPKDSLIIKFKSDKKRRIRFN
jgi:hypothetical protein